MGVEHLALGRTRKVSACSKEEGEGVWAGGEASVKNLRIERQALEMRAVRRIGLDELIVEEESWVRSIVEQLVGIVYIWHIQ